MVLINGLIKQVDAVSPSDHGCLGALLLSSGVAFLLNAGASDGEVDWIVEQSRRLNSGRGPLPTPGSLRD
jgi:hypothetical protein